MIAAPSSDVDPARTGRPPRPPSANAALPPTRNLRRLRAEWQVWGKKKRAGLTMRGASGCRRLVSARHLRSRADQQARGGEIPARIASGGYGSGRILESRMRGLIGRELLHCGWHHTTIQNRWRGSNELPGGRRLASHARSEICPSPNQKIGAWEIPAGFTPRHDDRVRIVQRGMGRKFMRCRLSVRRNSRDGRDADRSSSTGQWDDDLAPWTL